MDILKEWYMDALLRGFTTGTYEQYVEEVHQRLNTFYGYEIPDKDMPLKLAEFSLAQRAKEMSNVK